MKKLIYLFTVFALAASLAVFAFAADDGLTVVYLEAGATGDGLSADHPVGSLGKAVEMLDKSKDCTIVVCGKFSQTGIFSYPEKFSGSITLTSVYDGIDYRKFGAEYDCVGARFICSGEYIFKDINIILSGKYMFVIANHNPFTLDTGVTIVSKNAATDGLGFGTAFGILGGYQSGQPELRGVKDPPPAESNEDTNITVLSGEYICISAYSRQIDGAYYTGTANITIGGDAKVGRVFTAPANKPFTCGKAIVTVKDNATVNEIYASTSTGFGDSLTLNWLGGTIGKYSDRLADGNDILFSNGKKLFYGEGINELENFEAISKTFDKVLKEGETEELSKTVVEMTIGEDVAFINGSPIALDAAPIIRNSRTMLPVRFLANAFGVPNDGIKWDGATRTATLTNSEVSISVTIDAPSMTVNGETIALDSPAIIEQNRTYLPVRAIANALGVSNDDIKWDGVTSTATLTKYGVVSENSDDGSSDIGSIAFHTISELNGGETTPDSHKDVTANSSVELNYREYVEINKAVLATSNATYPRIKKMANGEYILFYQNGQIGSNIYYTTSRDTLKWENADVLFRLHAVENIEGKQDTVRYSTCDAVVLENGDILAVASFRYNLGYSLHASQGGLAMRRSTDNGKTWSDEEIIYVGINWEPYMTQAENGEVQIFFTHNAPKFHLDGKVDKDYLSSGVGMLRSADNGKTWTPNVKGAPYSAYIVMQQKRNVNTVTSLFTDQMPSVAHLNNGTSVMAVESRPDAGELYISLGYSDTNWRETLTTEQVGPAKRSDNIFEGAAPYIMQFDSGETLLSYNVNSRFSVRVGDANGENFASSIIPFSKTGYWGTLEKRSSHSAIGSMANVVSGNNAIMVGTMYLNHLITAANSKVNLDGNTDEWKDNTEALFIGSDSQAQVAIRASVSDGKLYMLFERADYYLTAADSITLYLTDDNTNGFWRIRIGAYGIEEFTRTGETIEKRDVKEIGYGAKDIGTIANHNDTDIGKVIEISIPMSIFTSENIRINATLFNQDNGDGKTSDTFSGVTLASTANWPLIKVK